MDAFFAAVEQRDHPEWRGKPVIVGAAPDRRGVVAAASYEARAFGVRSAMPSREAGRLCPQGIFVAPRGARYQEVSEQIFEIFSRYTPFVEPLSLDEAFLDVTGSRRLHGEPETIARAIKRTIAAETGLTASVGVAPNKFLAKLASEMNKPDGLTVVPSGQREILAFLAPMPVDRLWGVGRMTRQILEEAGWRTIGDLQRVSQAHLAARLGAHAARHLQRLALGQDDRTIELDREEKSMSREYTFPEDCRDPETVALTLGDLADDVAARVRRAGLYADVAHLKLRWQGFETLTRQKRFPHACCDNFGFREAAMDLLKAVRLVKPVRLVGFGVSGFRRTPEEQLELFDETPRRDAARERISRSLDAIRRRFGPGSIRRAASAGDSPWNGD
jgi:DNA polymerase-4